LIGLADRFGGSRAISGGSILVFKLPLDLKAYLPRSFIASLHILQRTFSAHLNLIQKIKTPSTKKPTQGRFKKTNSVGD